jgi:hypothetical protein
MVNFADFPLPSGKGGRGDGRKFILDLELLNSKRGQTRREEYKLYSNFELLNFDINHLLEFKKTLDSALQFIV